MKVNCKKLNHLILWLTLVISFIIFSLIRFPYKTETLASHKIGELLNISGKSYSIIDITQTSNATSMHYFLKDENEFYVVSFKRFPYWNRFASSHIMPLQEGTIYESTQIIIAKGVISRNGENLSFTEQKSISWKIFPLPFALVVTTISVCLKSKDGASGSNSTKRIDQ